MYTYVWECRLAVKRFNRLCRPSAIVRSHTQRTAHRCWWAIYVELAECSVDVTYLKYWHSHPITKTFSPMCCCWDTWMRPDCRVHVSQCLHVRGVYIETKRPTFYFFAWRFATLPLDVHGRLFLSWSLFLQCAHIHSSYRYLCCGGCDGAAHTDVINRSCTLALPSSRRCCNNIIWRCTEVAWAVASRRFG